MCRTCYEAKAYGDPYHCLHCGRSLPGYQVNQRRSNPRELKHVFCPGECLDYHKVLAGIVLGVHFNTNRNQLAALPRPEDEDEIIIPQPNPVMIGYRSAQSNSNLLPVGKQTPNGSKYLPFPKPKKW